MAKRKISIMQLPKDKEFMGCFMAPEGYKLVYTDICYMPETDILTTRGWVPILEVTKSHKVLQVDANTLQGTWVHPNRVINKKYKGTAHKFGNRRGTLRVTEDHTMLWIGQQQHPTRPDKAQYRKISKAQEGIPTTGCHFAVAAHLPTKSAYTDWQIWMACMIQADGSISKTGTTRDGFRIEVSIPRKVTKVRELLNRPADRIAPPAEHQNFDRHSWYFKHNTPLITKDKLFDLSNLGANQVEVFVEALAFWDGSWAPSNKRIYYSTMQLHNAEEVQKYLVTSGYEANISQTSKGLYVVSIRKHNGIRMRPDHDYNTEYYQGHVGCVTVPSGFVLVRSGKQTFVCGNCALEPHVLAHFSQDPGMLKLYGPDAKPNDVYLFVGAQTEKWGPAIREHYDPFNPTPAGITAAKRHCHKERKAVKPVYLGWSYGLGPHTMEAQTGLPLDECKTILHNIDSMFPGTVLFAEALREMWRSNGGWAKVEWLEVDGRRKPKVIDGRPGYILNGRNRPLAVAPEKVKDLVNRFVQSTGHDVMLQLLVYIERMRRDELPEMRPYHVDLHDATIWAVPEEEVAHAQDIYTRAYKQLNETLDWTVKISGDIEVGDTLADFLED